MADEAGKTDVGMSPEAWIRGQKTRLAEQAAREGTAVGAKERIERSNKRKLMTAFAPIAKFLETVAQAEVSLESYGAGHNLVHTRLQPPSKTEPDYQVRFEVWVSGGLGMSATADDYSIEEWGFGVRAVVRGDRMGFENYNFGRKGGRKEEIPLQTSPKEALKTFMDQVESHMVHIDKDEPSI
jgi:hypothetical protein